MCVRLRGKTHLEKALKLLESYKEPIDYDWFDLKIICDSFLVFDPDGEKWCIFGPWILKDDGDGCVYIDEKNVVSLKRLEELLKEGV